MVSRTTSLSITAMILFAAAPRALAHDGHGNPDWFGSVLHYVFEPAHLPLTLGILLALVVAGRWASDRLRPTARARRR